MSDSELKRGALSDDEREFIAKSAPIMGVKDIGRVLNRLPKTIRKYIDERGLKSKDMADSEYLYLSYLNKLRTQPYYHEIKMQLDDHEVKYFEETWIKLVSQFKEDVLYSEELQIKQWIILEVIMNRSMKERRKLVQEIEAKEQEINCMENDGTPKDIISFEKQALNMIKSTARSYSDEHIKLSDKIKDLQKELKMSREQRVKKATDDKSTFNSLLAQLDDREKRSRIGEEVELFKLAGDKAAEDLAKEYTYIDGTIDQPLLTPETLQDN